MPARRRPIDVHGQAAEVIERESLKKIPWKIQRLQGIRLAMEGQDGYRRIAQIVRTTAATLIKWREPLGTDVCGVRRNERGSFWIVLDGIVRLSGLRG